MIAKPTRLVEIRRTLVSGSSRLLGCRLVGPLRFVDTEVPSSEAIATEPVDALVIFFWPGIVVVWQAGLR